jgi:copper chaperone CopZ
MKKIAIIIFTLLIAMCNIMQSKTVTFITLGVCFACELRIEGAVKKVPGVDSVLWVAEKKATTVIYDETVVNIDYIMKAIAEAGHDTEWYRGSDSAYELLKKTCCEYERTIDYSKVQIGYLSLMNTWVSVENEFLNNLKFSISPNIVSSGALHFSLQMNEPKSLQLNVFSLNGTLVYSESLGYDIEKYLDVSKFAKGEYFFILSDEKKILNSSRVVIL